MIELFIKWFLSVPPTHTLEYMYIYTVFRWDTFETAHTYIHTHIHKQACMHACTYLFVKPQAQRFRILFMETSPSYIKLARPVLTVISINWIRLLIPVQINLLRVPMDTISLLTQNFNTEYHPLFLSILHGNRSPSLWLWCLNWQRHHNTNMSNCPLQGLRGVYCWDAVRSQWVSFPHPNKKERKDENSSRRDPVWRL